jgi:hypothetical protein
MTNDELFEKLDKLSLKRNKAWRQSTKDKLDTEILQVKIELTRQWHPETRRTN